jgi:hypothetical protein
MKIALTGSVICRRDFLIELKKEGFPGFMVHMPPGNPFPQIYVVYFF